MGKLCVLNSAPVAASEGNVDFVLIQGLGTSPAEEWAIASTPWREFLSTTNSRVRLLTYKYKLVLNDTFSLVSFLEEGEKLLDCLSQYQTHTDNVRPVVLICHSLGAFILKHALCIANAQSHRFGQVLDSTLGIVFLGGPHAASNAAILSERSLLILRTVPNTISKQGWERLTEESKLLVDISRLFRDIELRVEILSLYETKETRVKVGLKEGKGLFSSYRKMVLVDEKIAATGAPREQCFALAGEHGDLCKLEQIDGKPDQRLREWMAFVLSRDSFTAINRRLKSLKITNSPTASLTSMSSYNAARIALGSEPLVHTNPGSESNNPTTGSSGAQGWEIVPIIKSFISPRRFAQLPCFMMETPVRNRDFFGRESILLQLDKFLLPSELTKFSSEPGAQKHVVLYGMGGLGKTSVAIEFAFSRRDKFDAIFWIRADEPAKLDQDFCQIAFKLGLEDASENRNPVISRELARGWLTNPKKAVDAASDTVGQAEANWLVIFDNADRPDMLQDYWPLSGTGSMLVTSRDPLSKTSPSIASLSIDIEPFNNEEAATFLRQLSHNSREEDVSLKIAKKLYGLPLAISQMAAIIRYQYLSFSEFLERYEDESDRKELYELEAGTPRQETRGNVASIWAVDQLQPHAKAILEVCSVLDPDCIQEQLFLGDVSTVKLVDNFPRTTSNYHAARADLIQGSLIKRNEDKKEIWVHRVLQDSVQIKMSAERRFEVFATALSLVATTWGSTPLDKRHLPSLWKSRNGLFPHVLSLKAIYKRLDQDIDPECNLRFAFLLNESGWFQHEQGNSQDAKPFLNLALSICKQNPSEKAYQIMADVHYGLAAAANETNDPDACLYHTKILLEMRLEAFKKSGKPDLRLAVAHNELAIAWVLHHEYQTAIEGFENSIQVYRGLEGYWLAIDSNPRINMGFTYWVIGDYDKASTVLEDILRDRETIFGPDDTESYRTGRVYHGLGNVRYSQGRFEESEQWHRRALSQYQIVIGNNHHKTADLCYRIAQHCVRRGETRHAEALIDQALKVWQLRETVFIPEIARGTFFKARLWMQYGDKGLATALFKDAIRLRRKVPGASKKPDVELRESDFDELVTFYSR